MLSGAKLAGGLLLMSNEVTVNQQAENPTNIFELIRGQQLDKIMATKELIDVKSIDVSIGGDNRKILNQEVMTEYTNHNMTKYMVKIASYPDAIRMVFHLKDYYDVPLVPKMHDQIVLKMKSHKRKGSQEFVNVLRNEIAGTEVIPSNTRKKKFFGVI